MSDDLIGSLRSAQSRVGKTREALAQSERVHVSPDAAIVSDHVDRAAVLAQLNQDPDTRDKQLEHVTDETGDSSRVFVVHGRNLRARNAVFQLLRSVRLHPITWEEAVRLTGRGGTPTTLEVVRAGLQAAAAILVLLTPDEAVRLRSEIAGDEANQDEGFQPRPNVLVEAGMALALAPQRTILVHIGQIRDISDISGINFVRLSNDPSARMRLLMRLEAVGCTPVSNEDFVDPAVSGDFSAI